MHTINRYARVLSLISLAVVITVAVSGSFVHAYVTPYPIGNFDFTLSTSTTLVKMEPGLSGVLTVWVSLFCPNSSMSIRCDSTVLQTVTLRSSGCPPSSFCMLDRAQVLVPPLYDAGSNFVIYSTSCSLSPCSSTSSGVTTVTVTGTDQFGHTHTTAFGVAVTYS
jgi:hypothetical protein